MLTLLSVPRLSKHQVTCEYVSRAKTKHTKIERLVFYILQIAKGNQHALHSILMKQKYNINVVLICAGYAVFFFIFVF
jgi:hypothetical protein